MAKIYLTQDENVFKTNNQLTSIKTFANSSK